MSDMPVSDYALLSDCNAAALVSKDASVDVYGELLGAAYLFRDHLNDLDRAERDFLCYLADGAARDWRAKDSGIWEIRGPDRHYVHSKLMCWLALDRALQMAGFQRRLDDLSIRQRASEITAE